MRRAPGGVAVLAAALLAACGGGGGEPEGPRRVEAPRGVGVEVLQYRSGVVARKFQLKVRNDGSGPLTVLGVRLASARFAGEAVWAGQQAGERVEIGPGEATDLPVRVPPARCGGGAGADDARLDLLLPDGGTGEATLRVSDPFELLGRLRDDDCRLAGVERIARLSVAAPLRVQGSGRTSRAFLVLRIEPAGGPGTVTLETVEPTTLLAPPPGTVQWELGRAVSASAGGGELPLEIRPARCDPHAVAEDKLGTVLRIGVTFSSGQGTESLTPGRVEIASPVPVRNQVYDWVGRVCGNT